ncbi:Bug family tripartite tricarboxylate transporter substrate binding protein [Xylophilus sp.]|uniref:Bug family tripartite tricarboxylate transporter substrate binding protein n=1 Tax=Xylophilus sp. TaxID=2653893 RepID=UPI0013B9EF62|nr:tripartite tricarboxylate transporter substrate binding protein [Xylophilus sp.]KAF1050104.1 MAG: hypothetical protein GAK38_00129 [Xylophilus sp.]
MTPTSRRLLLASLLACVLPAAHAAWPDRPIRVVVPSAAGGSPDILMRLFGNELAKRLDQSVVIDNRPGAAGNIGMQAVSIAAPDGYTIGYGNNATLATNEHLFSRLPYEPAKLVPVVALASSASLLVVNKDLPIQTTGDLIHYAKAHPDSTSFGSGGTGTSGHLGAELFKSMTGIASQHVPYKGAPQAINDLMGGNVQFLFDNVASVGPSVAGGKVRAIAITSRERSLQFPNVPTLDESGVKGFEMQAWGGLVAPPQTPADIVSRLNREINAILQDQKVRAQLGQLSFMPMGGSSEDFRRLIQSERLKWGEIVRKSGAKVD